MGLSGPLICFLLLFLLAFLCFISQFASLLVCPSILKMAFGSMSLSPRLSCLRACIRRICLYSSYRITNIMTLLSNFLIGYAIGKLDDYITEPCQHISRSTCRHVTCHHINTSTCKHVSMYCKHVNMQNVHITISTAWLACLPLGSATVAKISRARVGFFPTWSFNWSGTVQRNRF